MLFSSCGGKLHYAPLTSAHFHCALQDVCSRSPSIISLKTAERFVLELKKSGGSLGVSVAVSRNSLSPQPALNRKQLLLEGQDNTFIVMRILGTCHLKPVEAGPAYDSRDRKETYVMEKNLCFLVQREE